MFYSKLILDPTSRQVQSELADPYQMHRTILRAFPDLAHGGPGRVLWRLDSHPRTGQLTLLVQSDIKPDWSFTQLLPRYLLPPKYFDGSKNPDMKECQINVAKGHTLAFRLRANPTFKKKSQDRKNGFRLGLVREEDQRAWLARKAEANGFHIRACRIIDEGMVIGRKTSGNHRIALRSVLYEGILTVEDPVKFHESIAAGIGPGKAFGFGLLSLAPIPLSDL